MRGLLKSIENLKFGNKLPFWPAIVPAGAVFAAGRLKYPPAASHIPLRISDYWQIKTSILLIYLVQQAAYLQEQITYQEESTANPSEKRGSR
ncbi:hypothetical protein RHDC2_00041 [Rhodocyclaceae bacterium]|nr:hypothetical protein RHDC2_00041 [Rhodocyclaceae bacterium]